MVSAQGQGYYPNLTSLACKPMSTVMPSGMKYSSLRGQTQTTTVKETHQKKLMKLSERQDRPLGKQGVGSVKALDDVELPNLLK